jgi:hypothetical protein
MLVGENASVGDEFIVQGLGLHKGRHHGRKTRRTWEPDNEPASRIITPPVPFRYSTKAEIEGLGAVVPMLPIMAPMSQTPTEVQLSDLGRGGRGGGRHHGGGRRWYGGGGYGYPYLYPPDYYTQAVEPPRPKYVLIDPNGKAVTIIRELPAQLPAGYTFRVATPAEAATGVLSGPAGPENYSRFSAGQNAWAGGSEVFGIGNETLF